MSAIHLTVLLLEAAIAVLLLLWHGKKQLGWFIGPWGILLASDYLMLHGRFVRPYIWILFEFFALALFFVGGIWMLGMLRDALSEERPRRCAQAMIAALCVPFFLFFLPPWDCQARVALYQSDFQVTTDALFAAWDTLPGGGEMANVRLYEDGAFAVQKGEPASASRAATQIAQQLNDHPQVLHAARNLSYYLGIDAYRIDGNRIYMDGADGQSVLRVRNGVAPQAGRYSVGYTLISGEYYQYYSD